MKYSYNQEVYIKEGFYRGYKAKITDVKETVIKDAGSGVEVTETSYLIKVENITTKNPLWLTEKQIMPYKKYIIF